LDRTNPERGLQLRAHIENVNRRLHPFGHEKSWPMIGSGYNAANKIGIELKPEAMQSFNRNLQDHW
jgi:hypothetical protein